MNKTASKKRCPSCQARKKYWAGANPVCAFSSGEFSSENYRCATLDDLRRAIGEHVEVKQNSDQSCVALPFSDCGEYLVVGWYKNRGRTETCIVVDGAETRTATLVDIASALTTIQQTADWKARESQQFVEDVTATVQKAKSRFSEAFSDKNSKKAFNDVCKLVAMCMDQAAASKFTSDTYAVELAEMSAHADKLSSMLDHIHATVGGCDMVTDVCNEERCQAQVVVTEVHCTTLNEGWAE